VPTLLLGKTGDAGTITRLTIGVQNGTPQAIPGSYSTVSWIVGYMRTLTWTIDWNAKVMSLAYPASGTPINKPFTWNDRRALRLEFGHAGVPYSPASFEYFDNLLVTTPSQVRVAGIIRDNTGAPCARTLRLFHRDTGQLLWETRSDPVTGTWWAPTADAFADVQVLAEGTDACDRFLPRRTGVTVSE
jgi:hypothetical protein